MDIISLAKINALMKKGGIGYTEQNKTTLSWDGDTSKDAVLMDVTLHKIHDECLDLNGVMAVTLKSHEALGGTEKTMSVEEFSYYVVTEEMGLQLVGLVIYDDGSEINFTIVSIPSGMSEEQLSELGENLGEGIYVGCSEPLIYISKVEYNLETVHTINPKYLPEELTPKIIKFHEYFFAQYILALFANGGGSWAINNLDENYIQKADEFFKQFNTRTPIIIDFDVEVLNGTMRTTNIYYTKTLKSEHFDAVWLVFLVDYHGLKRITVGVIHTQGKDTCTVSLRIEPINLPEVTA